MINTKVISIIYIQEKLRDILRIYLHLSILKHQFNRKELSDRH